jgi:hypothetical protein
VPVADGMVSGIASTRLPSAPLDKNVATARPVRRISRMHILFEIETTESIGG